VQWEEKLIERVGERIVVGRWVVVASAGDCFSLCVGAWSARAVERRQRLCHSLRYGMGYAKTTGRRDVLGTGGQEHFKIRMLQKPKHAAPGDWHQKLFLVADNVVVGPFTDRKGVCRY
jgi:hypothetical protein